MNGKIFINYRRGDDAGHTGRLFDRLQDVFPPEQLFLDVDNIAPGLDFVRVLNERVAECDIVLTVIGKGWLDACDANGHRRLDDPDDFVRIEITSALNQGKRVIPVLVGEAQMPRPEELPGPLKPLARRNAVRLTHERFRADTHGLVKAIQQGLTEIDQQRETEAQAARRAQEEKDRRRQEVEAAQRAAEQAARKKAEVEAREKAEEERRRQVAMARQRAEEERSFVFAKRAGTLIALDEFLSAHPAGVFTADARQLRTRLQVRDEDFRRALSGNDAALLKSFIATYGNGTDVRQVRARLRVLEPKKPWITSKWGLVAASALIVLIGGSIFIGFKKGYGPSVTPTAGVIKTAPADLSDRTAPGSPGANPPLAPSVDAAAWSLLKETTDDDALKRFIEQYPQSAFRQDAQARIAELGRERAAKTEAAAKAAVEVATRLEAANQALEAERAKLATQTQQSSNEPSESAIQPNPERAAGRPLSGSDLIQAIKMELTRTGCYAGKLDDDWTSSAVKQSIVKFIKAANLQQVPDEPSTEFLGAIRNQPSRLCPLECTKTETESNGKCIAKTCPNGQQLDTDGSCQNAKQHSASRPSRPKAPAETSSSVARGTVATGAVSIRCDKSGCKEHRVVNAPGGLPCKHAFQGRRGGWHCTD